MEQRASGVPQSGSQRSSIQCVVNPCKLMFTLCVNFLREGIHSGLP